MTMVVIGLVLFVVFFVLLITGFALDKIKNDGERVVFNGIWFIALSALIILSFIFTLVGLLLL